MPESEDDVQIFSFEDMMKGQEEQTPEEETLNELSKALNGDKGQDPLFLDVEETESKKEEDEDLQKKDLPNNDLPNNDLPNGDESDEPTKTEKKADAGDSKSSFYREALVELFGEEIGSITIEDENGEEKEVPLDELDIDAEVFKQIVNGKREQEKEELVKGKVDTKGLSKFTLDLMEVESNGGDITALLQAKEAYSDPVSKLDLDRPQDQKQAIYLKGKANGLDDEDIIDLIKGYEASGSLKKKADEAKEVLEKSLEAFTEKKKIEAIEAKVKFEESQKAFRKEVKDRVTSKFQLKESVQSRIVDAATKLDDKGRYQIDDLYYKATQDPEMAAELALFLLDREEFIAQVSNKKVTEEKLKDARTIKITGSKKAPTSAGASRTKDRGVISFDEFK